LLGMSFFVLSLNSFFISVITFLLLTFTHG